jgi:3-hydroxybutyryl-CoA dehydrogenase
MRVDEIQRVAVLGAGTMGHGIGQCFAQRKYRVILYDLSQEILDGAMAKIRASLENFAGAGLMDSRDVPDILAHITTTTQIEKAVKEADYIQETVVEDLKVKIDLFQRIEEACPEKAIIATNTSGFQLTDMNRKVKKKERTLIVHWFNPPQIVPAVEIAGGEDSAAAVLQTVYELMERLKKMPVRVLKEIPGLVINRIQAALFREVLSLLDAGIVEPKDLDRGMIGSLGFRLACLGPVEIADFGGLDIWCKVMEELFPVIERSPEVPDILKEKVRTGKLGVKSGQGFYEYTPESARARITERDQQFLKRLKDFFEAQGNKRSTPEGGSSNL